MGPVHDLPEYGGAGKSVGQAKIRMVQNIKELEADPELYSFATRQPGVLHHC